MTSNSTEPPVEIPPLNGLSEAERDKYLLIATFLSVLIVFGVIVAIMHRKCRESLYRSRSWIISKTVQHRPNFNRTISSSSGRAFEVSLSDPSSPVYSKEVYAPVMFFLGNDETSSSSGKSRKDRRLRNSGTDHEDDSGISVISSSQNIPMCSLSKKCFNVNKDVNDNLTLTYNPSSISLDPDVNLVRVLAPEIRGNKTSNGVSGRPKLRRSSTVIDKMNFMSGYMPSSRDADFTVVTLTDESEPDIDSHGTLGGQFQYGRSVQKQRPTYTEGSDNPVFYLDETGRSKSLSDFELYENVQTSKQKSTISKNTGRLYNDIKTKRQFSNHIVHKAEVHMPLKKRPASSKYKRSDKTRNKTRPKTSKQRPVIKTIDKESQQLYKRVMRERIQEIIYSDSSSVKSDQTFVRSHRKKKHKIPSTILSRS